MTRIYYPATLFLIFLAATPVLGQSFLRATVRDFFESHPDMQRPLTFGVFQAETGIVEERLDADQKPIFNSAGVPFETVTTKENFDQWYRHIDDVNFYIAQLLPNQSLGGGFAFADESFFPIDDFLFGNEFNFHNYHFNSWQVGCSLPE